MCRHERSKPLFASRVFTITLPLSLPSLAQRITDVRKQNGHYNRSTSNSEGLAKTIVKGRKGNKPAKEVATRWNSTLTVLARWYVTAPHQKANREKFIKKIRQPARSRTIKNPVTDELIKVVGQAVTVGMRVLECTQLCESNSVSLLSASVTLVRLYSTLKEDSWLVPTSPEDIIAVGQKDIRKIPPEMPAIEIDDILFRATRIPFSVSPSRCNPPRCGLLPLLSCSNSLPRPPPSCAGA